VEKDETSVEHCRKGKEVYWTWFTSVTCFLWKEVLRKQVWAPLTKAHRDLVFELFKL
jgi:hypothetical protein